MSRILYVDVVGGAAGDMLLAALLDAGAPLGAVRDAVEAVAPGRFDLGVEAVTRAGMRALLLRTGPPHRAPGGGRRALSELLAAVDAAELDPQVRAAARSALSRLGEAEARVHGIGSQEVELHGPGDDTLLDVVGVCAAVRALGIGSIQVSSVPLPAAGSVPHGRVEVPLPAPATLELLRGFRLRGEGIGETVTPTAAAILAALGSPVDRIPEMTLEGVGYGAGTRDPERHPNVVRVLVGTAAEPRSRPGPEVRELSILETNLDDLTPELVADAADALRAAGALDVWVTPVHMKKGRSGSVLSASCEPEREAELIDAFFASTSTFGVRVSFARRTELDRRVVRVPLREGDVGVKLGLLAGRAITATPEHDDVADLARRAGRPVREVYEEAAAAAQRLLIGGVQDP